MGTNFHESAFHSLHQSYFFEVHEADIIDMAVSLPLQIENSCQLYFMNCSTYILGMMMGALSSNYVIDSHLLFSQFKALDYENVINTNNIF